MPVSALLVLGRADPIRVSNRKRTARGLVLSLASRVSTLATVWPITKEENRSRVVLRGGPRAECFSRGLGRDSHPTAAGAIRARLRG